MKILDKHLWKAALGGLLIAWIALVILDVFFAFISEANKIDELYSTTQVFIYLVFTLPSRFYEFFPMSILIGALLGLGGLAANSEFIAMRAAGVSIKGITFSILKLGLLLAILVFVLGEWVVPNTDLHARNFKAHLKNKNITLVGGNGLWVKDKNSIIHIGKVLTEHSLSDISIYTFKKGFSGLEHLKTIGVANNNKNGWLLEDVNTSTFKGTSIHKKHQESQNDNDFLDPQILTVANIEPEQLSSTELKTIIDHQKENQLKSDKYELIYWKRYSVPLSALVMLMLAMPFLFGSNRGGGAGQRVFIGIIVGIVFSLVSRSANELGIVYGFSPLISAFLPLSIFFIVSLFFLNRIR